VNFFDFLVEKLEYNKLLLKMKMKMVN